MQENQFMIGAAQLDELQQGIVLDALATYRRASLSYDVAQQNAVRVIEGLLRDGVAPEITAPIFPTIRQHQDPEAH